jgi:hypothetical protein
MNHIAFVKDFTADVELFRDESYCRDPATLSIPPVMHQSRGFIDMPSWDWFRAAEPYDTAAPLFFTFFDGAWDF